jgi:hypothetical protein
MKRVVLKKYYPPETSARPVRTVPLHFIERYRVSLQGGPSFS